MIETNYYKNGDCYYMVLDDHWYIEVEDYTDAFGITKRNNQFSIKRYRTYEEITEAEYMEAYNKVMELITLKTTETC